VFVEQNLHARNIHAALSELVVSSVERWCEALYGLSDMPKLLLLYAAKCLASITAESVKHHNWSH